MTRDGIKLLLASGLGTGLLPRAPGTWGSAAAAGAWLLAGRLVGWDQVLLGSLTAGGVLIAGMACVALCPGVCRRSGLNDPPFVVADEFAGQWLALLVPTLVSPLHDRPVLPLLAAAVGFAFFRLFDIAKPPPCRRLEKLPGGWGILSDDLMAGLYAGILSALAIMPFLHA